MLHDDKIICTCCIRILCFSRRDKFSKIALFRAKRKDEKIYKFQHLIPHQDANINITRFILLIER